MDRTGHDRNLKNSNLMERVRPTCIPCCPAMRSAYLGFRGRALCVVHVNLLGRARCPKFAVRETGRMVHVQLLFLTRSVTSFLRELWHPEGIVNSA